MSGFDTHPLGGVTGVTGTPVRALDVPGTYTVSPDSSLALAIGANLSAVGTATAAELAALHIGTVRTTVSGANLGALETLAAGGIRFDLVLAAGQTVAQFMALADSLAATTLTTAGAQGTVSHSVLAVEGPDLTTAASVAAYTYTIVGNTRDTAGAAGGTASGLSGGDYATVELFQAATDRAATNPTSGPYSATNSATAIAGVLVLPYSTTGTVPAGSTVGSYVSALNVNLGQAPVGEPDAAAISAAAATAASIAQGYNLAPPLSAVVSQAGASTAGGLLDLLLDAHASVTGTSSASGTATAVAAPVVTTFISSLAAPAATGTATGTATAGMATGAPTGTVATSLSLFDANGSLTAAGTALANLEAILATPTTFTASAATTLTLDAGTYSAATQAATDVAAFAAYGGGEDIVWWDSVDPADGTLGHGAATLGFGQVESSVVVFDPTKGISALGSYSNISSLQVTSFGDGPLVVQVSGVAGSVAGGASAVGTFAGVSATATSTVTGGSGGGTTTMTGGSGGGTTTMSGGSGGGTVTTTTGASGTTTLTSTASTSSTITAPSGPIQVNSQGTDTVQAGSGLDVVFASGPAATVSGGTGTLVFVAGGGSYVAGGGTGTDILYGNSGPAVLTGGGTGNSILVAGTGNATLQGGAGSGAVLYGGSATNLLFGSTGGADTLVGGSGSNTFLLTNGDAAFGGANGGDTFDTGAGTALIVEGPGAERVNLGGGAATVFGGTGSDTYAFTKGLGGSASIIGFKAGDTLDLTGGFTQANAASALSGANTGSFGTVLHLSDGTTINVFGASVAASQISVT